MVIGSGQSIMGGNLSSTSIVPQQELWSDKIFTWKVFPTCDELRNGDPGIGTPLEPIMTTSYRHSTSVPSPSRIMSGVTSIKQSSSIEMLTFLLQIKGHCA